jgi:Cu/Ag efflux pump CusA
VTQQRYEPSIAIQVDLHSAERYGLTPGDVRRASATYFAGLPVGSLYEDQKIFDVVVWGVPAARQSPADVADLLMDTPGGDRVRLGDIARVAVQPEPTMIRHSNISRYLDVSADVSGRDLDDVLSDVRHRLSTIAMPTEVHAEVLSGTEPYQTEHLHLALIIIGAAIAVLLLLQLLLTSWRLALLIMLTVPLGSAGTVAVAPLVGGIDTLGPELAVLCVLGLTLRSSILLVRSFVDGQADADDAPADVVAVTQHHLVTVLLPPAVLAALVAPFAFGGVTSGTELLQPFAISCLCGLLTSVFVCAMLLPALYARVARSKRRAPLAGLEGT